MNKNNDNNNNVIIINKKNSFKEEDPKNKDKPVIDLISYLNKLSEEMKDKEKELYQFIKMVKDDNEKNLKEYDKKIDKIIKDEIRNLDKVLKNTTIKMLLEIIALFGIFSSFVIIMSTAFIADKIEDISHVWIFAICGLSSFVGSLIIFLIVLWFARSQNKK